MIYLVGVDHLRAQRRRLGRDLTEFHGEFRSIVESAFQAYDLRLLAEEDHPEYLGKENSQSILAEIARAHWVDHQFVEPSSSERKTIGYHTEMLIREIHGPGNVSARAHEIAHQFHKREEFWLNKLRSSLQGNVLFVCGWGHMKSFQELLARNYMQSTVLADQVGADAYDQEADKRVRSYIQHHPREFVGPKCFCDSQVPIPLV